MTWPLLLDYSRDDCKRMLRKLELEAYASLVTAFRAQGDLTKEKKKMLQDLCSFLSISLERHRAEIRRAVNDEKLNTIADRMVGPNTEMEWAIEGRRLVPLMPRLVPQTAFTALANNLANIQTARNAAMPEPSATGIKIDSAPPEEMLPKGRKRSLSVESPTSPSKIPFVLSPSQQSPTTSTPVLSFPAIPSPQAVPTLTLPTISTTNITSSTPSSFAHGSTMTPQVVPSMVKVPVKAGVGPQRNIAPAGTTIGHTSGKQVILVSGSGGTIPPSILQRCLSVPMVKAMTSGTTTPVPATILGKNTVTTSQTVNPANVSSPVTIAGSLGSVVSGNMVVYTTTTRARPGKMPNTGTRQQMVRPRGSSSLMGSPVHVQPAQPTGIMGMNTALQFPTLIGGQNKGGQTMIRGPSPTGLSKGTRGPSATTVRMDTSSVVLKQVTQGGSAMRILPKPVTKSAVVSAANVLVPSSSPQIMVVGGSSVAKTSTAGSSGTPRIVNVMSVTPAPVRQPPTNTYSSVGSKANRLAKAAASTGVGVAKPNVIVVHKAHAWPQTQQQQQLKVVQHLSNVSAGKMQIFKKTETKTLTMTPKSKMNTAALNEESPAKHVMTSPLLSNITELDPTQLDPKNTILADIIQATGISSDSSSPHNQTVTAGTIKKIQTAVSPLPSLGPLLATSPTLTSASQISSPNKNNNQSTLSAKTKTYSTSVTLASDTIASPAREEIKESQSSKLDPSVESFEAVMEAGKGNEGETGFQGIPIMEQLHEGQVLEIQAPDAANLLNSSGQLSKEVLALLQHVGIQLNQDQVTLDTSALNDAGLQLELPAQREDISVEGEVQLDPVTGMLYLQSSQDEGVSSEELRGLSGESIDLCSLEIVQQSLDKEHHQDEAAKEQLISESSSVVTVSACSDAIDASSEDPFQNLVVGECITVAIDGGGDGTSVEIGSEMETVISGECVEGQFEGNKIDLSDSDTVLLKP